MITFKFNILRFSILVFALVFVNVGCDFKTLDDKENSFLFNSIPSDISGIDFVNQITEDVDHNIINYIYYYNGGGVAVGDIDNDGLKDIFFVSNQNENKLYRNKGNLKFEDISKTSGIVKGASWNTGVSMVDINADGYLDIYICAVSGLLDFQGHNELFINNGDGSFTEKSKEYGLDFKGFSTQAYFFDYDKDDDLDVYIVNQAVHTNLSHGRAEARENRVPRVGDVLFKNEEGTFVDVSEQANIFGGVNGYGLSASIADFNNDGWEDIYVCNDFHEDDYYYINTKDGKFKEALGDSFSTISRFSMGSDAADINDDGYTDLITLDMLPNDERVIKESEGDDVMFNMQKHLKSLGYKDQYSRNMLQINNLGKYFKESAILNDITNTDWSWAPLIADFDNDGFNDIYITNGILRRPNNLDFKQYVSSAFKNQNPNSGASWLYKSINDMPNGAVANQLFRGGLEGFVNKTGNWIKDMASLSNGAAYADLDNDGDLDLITNNLNSLATIHENTTSNNFINLNLVYKGQNLEAIGAKGIVFTGNRMQTKQHFKSRGFLSSIDNNLNFGLDTISKVDSIQIIWPNLSVQTIINPAINKSITVKYVVTDKQYNYEEDYVKPYFLENNELDYVHSEDLYNDFDTERLIPYKVSMQGPAFAVGDIDNNGFDDIFIGNSSGKKSVVYLNDGKKFTKKSFSSLELDSFCEDNDAVFIDVDNDNDLDLYVASGINFLNGLSSSEDRLYINNNGVFEKSIGRIPVNNVNTSSVIANDYDLDGDMDIFVGNLSIPGDFGSCVSSFLLLNDGKGFFTKDSKFELCSKVNEAIWKDVNNDDIKDLLIATEWDVPKIFINKQGVFKEVNLPKSMSGLWQAITSYDIDKDGDQDILLGNWGLNTKYSLNAGSLKMYSNDFDLDGKKEVIVAYKVGDNYYPINSRDELSSQMKMISKRITSYKDYAFKTVEEIVGKDALDRSKEYEIQKLSSGYLKNEDGVFREFVKLAPDFQLAPINSFSEVEVEGDMCILVSGNSLRVNTYHGGYTSLKGMLMKDVNSFEPISNYGIKPLNNQIKGVTTINMIDKNILLFLSNNDSIKSYSYKKRH